MAKVKRVVPVPLMNAEERLGQAVSPRTAYGPHLRIRQHFAPEGRTKQSFAAECDINNIMKRYQRTGVLDFVAKHQGRYADVTGLEFQAAQDLIVGAKEMFMDLPAKVRSRFQNDAGQFLEFMSDSSNTEEAIKLGLATRRKDADGGGVVRGAEERVSAVAGAGAVRPGEGRVQLSGGDAGGSASPVRAVVADEGSGKA